MASVFLGINDRTFTYKWVAGRSEFQGTGFRNPMDFAFGPDNSIYVVNRSYESRADGTRINLFVLDEDGTEHYVTEFGGYGEAPGQFMWPMSIALDKDTNVYVSDEYLHRITIFDKDGNYVSHWGTHGSGDGELDRPAGLAIDGDEILVVDSRNNRVQKFTLDGKYVSQFGKQGTGPGEFNLPWGIGLDGDGNIFVADWRNDRVQSFTKDGQWLASFGQPGTGGDASIAREHGGIRMVSRPVGLFNRPTGVAVDKDGDVYVADWLNNRVQVLTPEGPVHHRVHRRRRAVQAGRAEDRVQPGHDSPAQRRPRLHPREGPLGPRGGEGGRQRPCRYRRHHPAPLPGLPEELRAGAGLGSVPATASPPGEGQVEGMTPSLSDC